jgi:hypothetical protein
MKWGKERPEIPSRFMMEMRGQNDLARKAAEAAEKLFSAEALALSGGADPRNKRGGPKAAAASRTKAAVSRVTAAKGPSDGTGVARATSASKPKRVAAAAPRTPRAAAGSRTRKL